MPPFSTTHLEFLNRPDYPLTPHDLDWTTRWWHDPDSPFELADHDWSPDVAERLRHAAIASKPDLLLG